MHVLLLPCTIFLPPVVKNEPSLLILAPRLPHPLILHNPSALLPAKNRASKPLAHHPTRPSHVAPFPIDGTSCLSISSLPLLRRLFQSCEAIRKKHAMNGKAQKSAFQVSGPLPLLRPYAMHHSSQIWVQARGSHGVKIWCC